jgi:hypothetical protein
MRVKTAISIPDATFERAERRARALGVSRSEFYAKAVLATQPEDSEIAFLTRAATELVDPHETW